MRRVLFTCFFLVILPMPVARAEVVIILRREAEATGSYVRVCDIARVEGPRDQASEVAMVVIGPTPGRGQTLELSRWDVETRLFEMGVSSPVTFTGNTTVRVVGAGGGSFRFSPADDSALGALAAVTPHDPGGVSLDLGPARPGHLVRSERQEGTDRPVPTAPGGRPLSPAAMTMVGQAVSQYLAGQYRRPDMEVEAKVVSADGDIPESVHEVRVAAAVAGRVPGKATLTVNVRDTAEAEPRPVTVTVDSQVFGLAPVAARHLSRGEVLDHRDVMVTRVRMESGKGYLPPTSRSVSGREVRRNLKPGEPILAADAVPSEAVKRGDLVVVDTIGQGWRVGGNAKAMGSGMVGDLITVEDVTTKARYQARITGRGMVAVQVYRDKLNKK